MQAAAALGNGMRDVRDAVPPWARRVAGAVALPRGRPPLLAAQARDHRAGRGHRRPDRPHRLRHLAHLPGQPHRQLRPGRPRRRARRARRAAHRRAGLAVPAGRPSRARGRGRAGHRGRVPRDPPLHEGASSDPHRRHDRTRPRCSPAIGLVLPQLFDLNVPPQSYPSPFDASLHDRPDRVHGQRHPRHDRGAHRDRRPGVAAPLHRPRHRHPGQRRERRSGLAPRRARRSRAGGRVGDRHGAGDRRHDAPGRHRRACPSAACWARRSCCEPWPPP